MSGGLAVAALRASPDRLLRDLEYFGLLFESPVVRDLRVYAQALGGEVLRYRDQSDLEVDAIVEAQGRWGAFEVKLGPARVDEAATRLLRFAGRVDTSRRGEPAVLGVIVGSGFGYVRDDGVHVIPVGSLSHNESASARAECHKVVTKSTFHVPFSAPQGSIETPPRSSLSRETP